VVVLGLPVLLEAQPSASASADGSREVTVGIHINQISGLSLDENRFYVEAYMWFRWDPTEWPAVNGDGPQVGATGTDRVLPYQTFEIIGSQDVTVEMNGLSPGMAVVRVRATVSQRLDLSRYPFDNHLLRIAIEDIEKQPEVILLPDTAGSTLGPDVFVNGWEIGPLAAERSETTYRTNFGDFYLDARNETTYSRVTFGIPIRRGGDGLFWKTYIGLLIAVGVTLLSFFVPVDRVDARIELNVGALFAAVGSQWIISADMPPMAGWSLSDRIHALGYATILCSLMLAVFRVWRADDRGGRPAEAARRWDAFCAVGIFVLWGGVLLSVH
jgi:hypothetical protein